MSRVVDTLFGDNGAEAAGTQARDNEAAREYLEQTSGQARNDATSLFDASQQNNRMGFQQMLDLLAQSAPRQLQAFQDGNVSAQNVLLNGATGPTRIPVDMSFMNTTLPEFQTAKQALGSNSPSTPSFESFRDVFSRMRGVHNA